LPGCYRETSKPVKRRRRFPFPSPRQQNRAASGGIADSPRQREERAMAARDDVSPTFQTLLYEKRGPICYITLNRPEKLTAASDQIVEDLDNALFESDGDPDLHVAILSATGRAFCSGADVQPRQLRTPEDMRRLGGPVIPKSGAWRTACRITRSKHE
jgi:hypothetical protein